MPRTSSESRAYLPAGLVATDGTVSSEAFAVFDAHALGIGIADLAAALDLG